jgi:hypothetical protein
MNLGVFLSGAAKIKNSSNSFTERANTVTILTVVIEVNLFYFLICEVEVQFLLPTKISVALNILNTGNGLLCNSGSNCILL